MSEDPLRANVEFSSPQTNTYEMSQNNSQCILSAVGATAPIRDSVDTRVINDFFNGTGKIIDNINFPDDFPVFENKTAPIDSDNDGMADVWESAHGMNVGVNDSANDLDGNGYTNIEEYLHSLAAKSFTYDSDCMSENMQF